MYYPKSQISPNLYTNGNELQIKSTGENYVGYYHKTSIGSYYSGKTPLDAPTVLLELNKNTKNYQSPILTNDVNNRISSNYPNLENQSTPIVTYELDPDYSEASTIDYESKFIKPPVNQKVLPTEEDYTLGQFQRYLLKKVNTPLFKEVPKEVYLRYKNKDKYVQYDLYIPIKTMWTLTGKDKNTVANINFNILKLTEQRYRATGLVNYFKNKLTEYYKKVGS